MQGRTKRSIIVTPDIRDAERLQGFPANWTQLPKGEFNQGRLRWRLVGNAVPVRVAQWIGQNLSRKPERLEREFSALGGGPWPKAAFGSSKGRFRVEASTWPVRRKRQSLRSFLRYKPQPLSYTATLGFYNRLRKSRLSYPTKFGRSLQAHIRSQRLAE